MKRITLWADRKNEEPELVLNTPKELFDLTKIEDI